MSKLSYCIALLLVFAFSICTLAQKTSTLEYHVERANEQYKEGDKRGLRESLASCDMLIRMLKVEEIEECKHDDYLNAVLANYYYLKGMQAMGYEQYQSTEAALLECYNILKLRQDHEELDMFRDLLVCLGSLYLRLNNIPYAIRYLTSAKFGSVTLLRFDSFYCLALGLLGDIFIEQGKYTMAKMYLDESLHTLEDIYQDDLPSVYYLNSARLCFCYCKMGHIEEAEQAILKAINRYEETKSSTRTLGSLYSMLGCVHLYSGDFASAKASIQKGYDISRGDKSLSAYHKHLISLDLAVALFFASVPKYMIIAKEQSSAVIEDVIQQFAFLSADERSQYWKRSLRYLSNFNVMLSCSNDPKYYDQVYDNIIFSKGLLLRTNNKISEQLAKPENESLRADVRTLHALQTRLVRDSIHTFDVYSTNDSIRQIEKKLAVNLIGYQSVDSIRNQYSIQTVKRTLGRGEAAIEFVRLREIKSNPDSAKAYYAAVVLKKDSRHPHIVRLCSEDSLLRVQQMPDEIRSSGVRPYVQNELYRQYLYGSGDYQWRPSGRKPIKFTCVGDNLYNMIWKPIESLLQGVSTIYYSTDGELNSMAFSAIPANGKNLAEKYTLNYLTSTAEIPTVKTKSRKKPTSASLYGGINYDTSSKEMSDLSRGYAHVRSRSEFRADTISIERGAWGFLLGSELEVTDISAQLTSAGVANKVFSESLANEESFKANSGNSPSILHIATHGFFYPNEKENNSFAYLSRFKGIEYVSDLQFTMNRAGLLFSGANHAWRGESTDGNVDDGILTADEISRLDLSNTDMVVLSACETGLGVNVISEGVLGLQRAFKLAGVQTLVMSLWKVPDDETREFMSLFYKNWLGGMDKREAFQAAQQEIKKAKPNPYYWAGFVMMD